jgi:hypothetical protein
MPESFERALEGTLAPEELKAFEEHLASCAPCAEEFRFARELRGHAPAAAPALSPRGAERLWTRTGRKAGILPPRPTLLPVPVLAGAGVFAVLLLAASFMASAPRAPRWTRPPVEVSSAANPLALKEAETRAAGRELGREVTPVIVAEFESMGEMRRISVSGGRQECLSSLSRSGKSALSLLAGSAGEPSEVRVDLLSWQGCGRTAALSVWVEAALEPVTLGVKVRTDTGETAEGTPARRVEQGAWRWVVFALPGTRGTITDVTVTVHGASPLKLDRLELWCARE